MKRAALLTTVGVLSVLGCHHRAAPDLDAVRAEIRALHQADIRAHLAGDTAHLAEPTAPGYVSVANGEVTPMTAEEMEARLGAYLDATEFSRYEDVAAPIIGVSDDGSEAWAIVQVRVAGSRAMPDGSSRDFDIRWAWLTLYERDGDRWLRRADVSTNRPWEE